MQITQHIYSTHIQEDQSTFGPCTPAARKSISSATLTTAWCWWIRGNPTATGRGKSWTTTRNWAAHECPPSLITHGHGDHIGGLDRLQEAFNCPVRCHPKLAPALAQRLGEDCVVKLRSRELVWTNEFARPEPEESARGELVEPHTSGPSTGSGRAEEAGQGRADSAGSGEAGRGVSLRALFTPGHEDDHVCYYLRADNVLFSGDNILGNSSSSVRNLKQYMESLELMAKQRPGHHLPRTRPDHPQRRGPHPLAATPPAGTGRPGAGRPDRGSGYGGRGGYGRLSPQPAQEPAGRRRRNVGTHLAKLREEGRVTETPATYTVNHE